MKSRFLKVNLLRCGWLLCSTRWFNLTFVSVGESLTLAIILKTNEKLTRGANFYVVMDGCTFSFDGEV